MKLRNMKTSLSTIKESNNDNLKILEKNYLHRSADTLPNYCGKMTPVSSSYNEFLLN